jgi:hypothetical protein
VSRLSALSGNLTLSEQSFPVLVGRTVAGAVIRNSGGLYVGWAIKRRLGEYATAVEAERAVRAAGKKKAPAR